MNSTKRALRRHHRERMIQRALHSWVLAFDDDPVTQRPRAARWADNLAKCSCWMCGNPRKHEGRLTVQEQRQLQAARDAEEL